jgi:hypothetical protein
LAKVLSFQKCTFTEGRKCFYPFVRIQYQDI